MSFWRSRRKMNLAEALDLFPSRAPKVETRREGEEFRVTVSRSPHPMARLVSHFMGLPVCKTFLLDALGARVWDMCDGQTSVRAVVERFAHEQSWTRDRAEQAVLIYLSTLSERKLIAFGQQATDHPLPGDTSQADGPVRTAGSPNAAGA